MTTHLLAMNSRFLGRYLPLVGHVVPTLVIAYGWVIPRSCIAGWNAMTAGFGLSVVGACIAYAFGERAAWRAEKGSTDAAT